MFPDVAFDEDAGWSGVWRGIFEEWLVRASEPPLWGEVSGERYGFQTSAGGSGILLRVEANTREAIAKRFEPVSNGWAVREFRRPVSGRELGRLRRLVEIIGFWALPSPNPVTNRGLDGARYLFETCAGGRYHLVQRWGPHRSEFSRLCRYCESLSRSVVEPRRAWWRLR